jgi:uroporphyrinogen decarboxylase
VRTAADVRKLRVADPIDDTGFVMEAIRILRRELADKVPLIGFAGAPFTLASYMIEGRGTREYLNCKRFMWSQPQAWDELLTVISDTVIAYLTAQIDAGAQAVQLFDSWVGYLSPHGYEHYVLPHSARVLAALSGRGVPVIHFANGATSMLDLVLQAGGDVIGLDWRLDIGAAMARLRPDQAVQGNIDPIALFAPDDVLEEIVVDILERVGTRPGHVFNLGHGIHKTTDPEKARTLVRLVHEQSRRILSRV